MRRAFTAPSQAERCTGNVTLSDGSGAQCMHKRITGDDRCRQHPRVYVCPFCEHMPDGATVKLCAAHECKACVRRYEAGLPGQCPSCANERARKVDDRPSIVELSRKVDDDGKPNIAECAHKVDDRPSITELQRQGSNGALVDIAIAALAFVATQGDRTEPEWGDLTLALSRIRL
jgi:hypothetical protein